MKRLFPSFIIGLLFAALFFVPTACLTEAEALKNGSNGKDTLINKLQPTPPLNAADNALLKKGVGSIGKKAVNRPADSLTAAEIAQLRQGDLLLRRGYGAVSDFITDFLEEKYTITHCGFVVRPKPEDSIMILHTVSSDYSEGVLIEPLADYIESSQLGSLAAVRPKFSEEIKEKALEQAFDLLRRKVKFDMEFDDRDSTKLYCVEMVRNSYERVIKKDILPKRITRMGIEVTQMSNFFNEQYFEVLFNHCEPNF